jgi:hypothetical protein
LFGFLDGWSIDNLNAVIVSVVRYTQWPPSIIDQLYIDDLDYHGLLFWYNDAKQQATKAEKSLKGNNGSSN